MLRHLKKIPLLNMRLKARLEPDPHHFTAPALPKNNVPPATQN
jgi:hypothetical protein